jgi:DNA-directed RNA polymerase specialized sigma24 family protein
MTNMSQTELWYLAQVWVKSNRVLIWCIAGPYFRYMSCEVHDLESEALLTAHQVLTLLCRKSKSLSHMNRYYRVVFRTRCISLTTGLQVKEYEIEDAPAVDEQSTQQEELDETVINESLQVLTNRQRQISEWILAQPTPVSTATVGKKFGIGSRTVRVILNNAIRRIEHYGYQPICESVATPA